MEREIAAPNRAAMSRRPGSVQFVPKFAGIADGLFKVVLASDETSWLGNDGVYGGAFHPAIE